MKTFFVFLSPIPKFSFLSVFASLCNIMWYTSYSSCDQGRPLSEAPGLHSPNSLRSQRRINLLSPMAYAPNPSLSYELSCWSGTAISESVTRVRDVYYSKSQACMAWLPLWPEQRHNVISVPKSQCTGKVCSRRKQGTGKTSRIISENYL